MDEKIRVDKLNFWTDLIDQILSGEKHNTWRIWPDKYVLVGDELDLVNEYTGRVFGRARIMEKCVKKFMDLTSNDKEGHEKFGSEDEMYQFYSDYYEIPVDERTEITVIKFQLI